MSWPYTSAQNGKAERIIRSTNNIIRSLLFQASMPPSYWVEALATATYLLNILPTKTLQFVTPHFALHGKLPSYDHLRVFGCVCYPNLSATASHKLAPRSTLCVFLGYSPHHKGYRCLDTVSNRVIISRHVTFDEATCPFSRETPSPTAADFVFLDEFTNAAPVPIGPSQRLLLAGTSGSPPAHPCADDFQAPSPALPCAPPGLSSPALPRAAPGASSPALPRAAPTVPPGFAPRSPAPAVVSPAPGSTGPPGGG